MPRWFALPAYALAMLPLLLAWWWEGRPRAVPDAPADRAPCVSFAPYRAGQSPLDEKLMIPEAQVAEDLDRLRPITDCVRTYAVEHGLDVVPRLAAERGMSVMLGAWIGLDNEKNEREISKVIELARRYPGTVRAVVVGNEVLLRREQPPDALAATIDRVRAAVTPVPVTYADVWEFWEKNPRIADAVDFVTIHTLPYWEDEPRAVEDAVRHAVETRRRIQRLFPDRPVFIGEAGWPSAGRMREGARPGLVEQARFVRELLAAAAREGFGVNVIEAFDQPWKRAHEGTVGGHWGLLDVDRHAKFPLRGPVSADPRWLERFGLAAVLGILLLVPAAVGATGARAAAPGSWLGTALGAAAAGSLAVIGIGEGVTGALTLWDWAVLTAVAACGLVAAALASAAFLWRDPTRPLPIARLIDRLRGGATLAPGWAAVLGGARAIALFGCAATTLCLVFDGRYRDFPVALYALPAGAFLLLAATPGRGGRERAGAEAAIGARGSTCRLDEEWLLALVAAAGACVLVVTETLVDSQAWGWLATAALFVTAVALDGRRSGDRLPSQQSQRSQQQPPRGGFRAVENEPGAAEHECR